MCDWEEGEYAEYLLWIEAVKARERAASAAPTRALPRKTIEVAAPPPLSVEA